MKSILSRFAAASVVGVALLSSNAMLESAQAASLGSCTTNIGPLVGNGGVGQSGFVGANDCKTSPAGNDDLDDVTTIFGPGWTRAFKTEVPDTGNPSIISSNEVDTFGNLQLTFTDPDGTAPSRRGTWTISGLAPSVQSFILAVKASNGNNANAQSLLYYAFNDLSVLSGDWSTFGLLTNGGQQPELSHVTVYTSNTGTTPIPTPALLPGLIGMGVAALRKRKGEAEESAEA